MSRVGPSPPTGVPPRDDHAIFSRPGHLIRRLQQIAVAIFMAETKRFNITPVQYSAILAIEHHPGIDQTALCNIIAYDRSTIGDVVTRLERKKLEVIFDCLCWSVIRQTNPSTSFRAPFEWTILMKTKFSPMCRRRKSRRGSSTGWQWPLR